jgi:hypothetical protein
MSSTTSAPSLATPSLGADVPTLSPAGAGRGGAETPAGVGMASTMGTRCDSTVSAVPGVIDSEGEGFANLRRVGGSSAPLPLACLRLREMDLVICDGAGIALYSLQVTSSTLRWVQRVVSYPPIEDLRVLQEDPRWAWRARILCMTAADAHTCRAPLGIVAAEARAAEELGELDDGEEAVYRLCEAMAARHQASGKVAAKAGRHLLGEIEKARYPSHVPLYRLRRALAEELALGHTIEALCSRSEGFSESNDERKVGELLFRRLGLLGQLDHHRRPRYARVASCASAVLLCEALDISPEQVGL